jgi:N-acyl-D-amino-acid deacylase
MRVAAWTVFLYSSVSLFAQTFDVVITGGRIIDGSGDPWYYGDLGLKGDTITAIGKLDTATSAA